MLRSHFYHRLRRKYISLFGSLFNDITFVRYNSAHDTEIDRIKVPITYSPKEKFVTRLQQNPDLTKSTQATLPRMSYQLMSMIYDPTRKQQTTLKMPSSTLGNSQYVGVPYDLNFELNIFTRTIEEGEQIVEQILPTFTPDYTVSVNLITSMGYVKDIPIILTDVNEQIDYEGDFESFRFIQWTLSFTMKVNFFGPVQTGKIIRKVYANTYIDSSLAAGAIVKMSVTGNGDFKLEDTVYQGDSINYASAAGIVRQFLPSNGILKLTNVQGMFQTNATIHAASTNASYNVVSFDVSPLKVVSIKVEPDPINAEPDDDFRYDVTLLEFPNTI